MTPKHYKTALTIAGFDGSGGAGIQADLKTFSALGCYGMSVLTSLPVQNTQGVRSLFEISPQCVEEQLQAIFEDISPNAIKIGMLHREQIICKVAASLAKCTVPIVLDPVMVAKSGDPLLLPEAVEALKKELFPHVTILTPNLPEASFLLGREIATKAEMEQAAEELAALGPLAVIVKGGHLCGAAEDCLFVKGSKEGFYWLSEERIPTQNTHGTGCTFSAAIASFLARGSHLVEAVRAAKVYLTRAIRQGAAYKIGKGKGPVHHFHAVWGEDEC